MGARGVALLACVLCGGVTPAAEPAHDHAAMAGGPIVGTYSVADLTFLTHMIVHHQQALELCALVNERSSREEFQRFSRYLNDAQQAEIDQMKGLLQQAAARGAADSRTAFPRRSADGGHAVQGPDGDDRTRERARSSSDCGSRA